MQLYDHFDLNKSSLESTISRMQDCICNVQSWLSNNKLKMNPDKTLFIAFVPPYYITLVDNININIGSSDINVVSSVTNLGVRLDRESKNDSTQTSHLMKLLVQLKLVNSIRACLDVHVAERSGERNLYIQTGLLQFFVGWPYSTGFYSPAKITETPQQDMY